MTAIDSHTPGSPAPIEAAIFVDAIVAAQRSGRGHGVGNALRLACAHAEIKVSGQCNVGHRVDGSRARRCGWCSRASFSASG